MARTIEVIYSEIIASKEAKPGLANLNSTSVTAIWRLWAWITAAAIFTVENMFDLFRTEITQLIELQKPGTLPWYQAMCKAFQYGDSLTWVDGRFVYPVINPVKQIIAQCSVSEGSSGLVIKIGKEDVGGLGPLSPAEESVFVSYLSRMKYAGSKVSLVNSAANKLIIQATVIYDPLLIHADGTLISDSSRPVDIAINNYLKNLPFNGILRRSAIMDAMQAAVGVIDVSVTSLRHQYGTNAYADIVISHIPESGYFKIDTNYPLITNITYNV